MNRILKTIILLVFIVLSLITISIATDANLQIEIFPNKTQVKEGETLELILEIDPSNIEDGVGAYVAELKYDDTLFEITKLEGVENWENPLINEGKIIATTNDGECINTKQNIAKITFSAKKDILDVITEIKIENFQASNTKEIFKAGDKGVEIGHEKEEQNENVISNTVGEENTVSNNVSNTTSNTISNSTLNNISNSISNTVEGENNIINSIDEENKVSNSIEEKPSDNQPNALFSGVLPYTGIRKSIVPIIILIIAVVMSVIYYRKQHKDEV